MNPMAKAQLRRTFAADIEHRRGRERVLVAIRRSGMGQHAFTAPDHHAAQLDILERDPQQRHVCRTVVAHDLFDRPEYQAWDCARRVELVGMAAQQDDAGADRAHRRLVTG